MAEVTLIWTSDKSVPGFGVKDPQRTIDYVRRMDGEWGGMYAVIIDEPDLFVFRRTGHTGLPDEIWAVHGIIPKP